MRNTRIFLIPKDPRVKHTIFLTSMPHALSHKINKEEWESIIEGLNAIIMSWEKPSFLNLLKILLLLPALFEFGSFDKDVRKYLTDVNTRIQEKGIFFKDPSLNSYSDLEVSVIE